VIRLVSVCKNYEASRASATEGDGTVHALRSVSLEVKPGEFVAVMGPSGCGKSTLLHMVGGLDTPTSGEVWVNEQPIHQMDETALSRFRRDHVGIVFQFFNLLPQLSTLENISLPLRLQGVAPAETEQRALALLVKVGLAGKADRHPAELSGGEQQRLAIARAVAHRPQIVLADEPTGNLDSVTAANVLQVLKDLQQEHRTALLLVTHSTETARAAHRILTMQDGQIVGQA
jgi:putative ABC transport system ATP-binding protein